MELNKKEEYCVKDRNKGINNLICSFISRRTMVINSIRDYFNAFFELIFPSYCTCIICKNKYGLGNYGICKDCLDKIKFIGNGRWLQSADIWDGISCRMFSVVEYQGEIRKLVYRLKYSYETYLAREMAKMMVDYMDAEGLKGDMIIPVPLYKSRERERGFNQANLLAKYISKGKGIPYSGNNLVRTKNTTVMHQLSKRQRRDNVNNAFSLTSPKNIVGLEVILVDDILTTGATVEACLKTLLEAGAVSVTVITFTKVSQEQLIIIDEE